MLKAPTAIECRLYGLNPKIKAQLQARCADWQIQVCDRITIVNLYGARAAALAELHADDAVLFLGCGLMIAYRACLNQAPIEDVWTYILDGHNPDRRNRLQQHFSSQDLGLTFDGMHLDIIPLMLSSLRPGILTSYDCTRCEFLRRPALRHPRFENLQKPYQYFQNVRVGANLRAGFPSQLDGLFDPLCGVIKEEGSFYNRVGLPQHITRTQRGGATSGGRAWQVSKAKTLSYCEAVERFLAEQVRPAKVAHKTYRELGDQAINPEQLFYRLPLALPNQHQYHADLAMDWVWVDHLGRQEQILIPRDEFISDTDDPTAKPVIRATTSGTALGSSYEEAVFYGLLELIERDSFLATWRLQRRCQLLDPDAVCDPSFQILRQSMTLRFPAYRVYFFDTTTDLGIPTVWVMACRQGEGTQMKTLSAAACRLSYGAAMHSALDELAGLMSFNPEFTKNIDAYRHFQQAPELVQSVEDHLYYYGLDGSYTNFHFFDFGQAVKPLPQFKSAFFEPHQNTYDLSELLRGLVDHLAKHDIQVMATNLTTGMFAARRLFCARVFASHLLPLSFGQNHTRFAWNHRLTRLAKRWGFVATDACGFNAHLHPLG